MSNQLGVAMINSIITLKKNDLSNREIASLLEINRGTVNRYVKLYNESENRPNPPVGSVDENQPNPPAGSMFQNQPNLPAGFSGPPSLCKPYEDEILKKLELGLSAQRIYQDLVLEHAFEGSYDSVKRYVRKLIQRHPLPCRRMECAPGKEAQVDFGLGAPVVTDGRKRRAWVFRITLSHSRKAYSEAVYSQSTENFIRALENSFRYFGGVPETLIIDNLRAAVKKADWFEPELNPKVLSFCEHYGTVILPARPYKPEHKGKVESSIKYVKNNALKGRSFPSLAEENRHLLHWEKNTADKRIHGTTRKQVQAAFDDEKSFLRELPGELFECFEEGRRRVHRDGYVEVERAYYMVPEEYCQREVWVRWNNRTVRVFNKKFDQIAIHARQEPGRFSDVKEFISEKRISAFEKGDYWIVKRASYIGPNAEAWARAVLKNRKQQGVRPLMGLVSLSGKYKSSILDKACEKALNMEAFRLKDVKSFLNTEQSQPNFSFMDKHPLIREMDFYGNIIKNNKEA